MHAARRARRRELSGKGAAPPALEPCPDCKGARGRTCSACAGAGYVAKAEAKTELDPETAEKVGEVLTAYALAERWGMEAVKAAFPGPLNRDAVLAMLELAGEIDRLEAEDEAEEARAAKAASGGKR